MSVVERMVTSDPHRECRARTEIDGPEHFRWARTSTGRRWAA